MNRPCIHVHPLPNERRGPWLAVRAQISGHPRRRRRNGEVYFEVPDQFDQWTALCGDVEDRHDVWLRSAIFPAMEAGYDLVIHGNVSAGLLANVEVYQTIIANWWSQYQVVNVSAEQEIAGAAKLAPTDALLTFSGGLDSIYTLYCHQRRLRGRNSRQIPLCIFVHGYDIPLWDVSFQNAFERARRIVESLGSQLAPVRTNLREMLPAWPECYPTALAAVLSLFSRRFAEGLVASSVTYRHDRLHEGGYGSSPTSDWLLSSHDFRITHDLANATRVEKTQVLYDCETAQANLRVCWAGDDLSTNCGVCPKCLWQMLCMKAVGLTDLRAFEHPLNAERVALMPVASRVHWDDLAACLDYARQAGRGELKEFVALAHALQVSPMAAARRDPVQTPHAEPGRSGLVRRTASQLARLVVRSKPAA